MFSPKTSAALGLTTVLFLVGCGGGGSGNSSSSSTSGGGGQGAVEGGNGGLAIVVGAHANSPAPQIPGEVTSAIDTAVTDGARLVLVSNEGEARLIGQGVLSVDAANSNALKAEQTKERRKITDGLASIAAEKGENNLLDAIDMAGRSIASVDGTKTIAVIDSGLQTTEPIQFQEKGMLEADPADIANYLEESDELPDLSGVTVLLIGFGDTAPPQEQLSLAQQHNVQNIWKTVLTDAGAQVEVVQAPQVGDSATGLPSVTTVNVRTASDFAVPAIVEPKKTVTIELTQEAVAFQPDSSKFVDLAATDKILEPIAQRVTSDGLTVHLVGSTAAYGTPAGRKKLSLARADAVEQRLVHFGVSARVITTEGVGSDGKDHVPDVNADGVLLPGPAAQNRKVTVELSSP